MNLIVFASHQADCKTRIMLDQESGSVYADIVNSNVPDDAPKNCIGCKRSYSMPILEATTMDDVLENLSTKGSIDIMDAKTFMIVHDWFNDFKRNAETQSPV
jgi:hypothetical protein